MAHHLSVSPHPSTFSYCGISMAAILDVGFVSVSTPVTIDVSTLPTSDVAMSGVKGAINHAILAKVGFLFFRLFLFKAYFVELYLVRLFPSLTSIRKRPTWTSFKARQAQAQ
jgi:hypothetical protein